MTTLTQLWLYDTMTREKHQVRASDGTLVRMYCCGPTVYRDAHVGNLRTFLLADLAVRTLQYLGYQTLLVQNITDVGHMAEDFDDKLLAQSKIEKRDPLSIAHHYESQFHRDMSQLNINPADHYPKASESIELMHDAIATLIENGNAYIGSDHSVYFSAQSFPTYGELSGNRLDALKPGHRYEYADEGAKRFHADWALWKSAGNRTELVWDSPWGKGFPGWHIECSAMSLTLLGETIDLHFGGIDLRFPHHENERAQSNSVVSGNEDSEVAPEVVHHWVHGEHLLFEGRKMSKSAHNVLLVESLVERGLDPLSARLSFLENRYRSQMNLDWEILQAAGATLTRWRKKIQQWRSDVRVPQDEVAHLSAEILKHICDDFDFPRALQVLRTIERDDSIPTAVKVEVFLDIDRILGLDLDRAPETQPEVSEEISHLLELRKQARNEKNFAESDRLRDQLAALGVEVLDTPRGQEWSLT